MAVFLDDGEAVVVVPGVGEVAEVLAVWGVDLDAAFFAAHDGEVEEALGIDVDFSVGGAEGFEAFWEGGPVFEVVVGVGGGGGGDDGGGGDEGF